jgi:hypothetical protein
LKGLSFVALCAMVVASAVGCGGGSASASATPYPTLIPLGTPSPSAPAASLPSMASPTPDPEASQPPTPLALPAEFTREPKAPHGFAYNATSKQGSLAIGGTKNIKLGLCGLNSPVDVDGSVWDPTYGDDGQGAALTDDQLNDLRADNRVTLTKLDDNTLQMVTKHGATVTLVRHDGTRRYPTCP